MTKGRLEAFSDGVIAILITIMVLELKVPHGADWAALRPLRPVFLTYVLSYVFLGIYWNNHHHMLHADRDQRQDPVGEPAPALLAVAGAVRHRLDGREPLRPAAHRGLRRGAPDGRHRVHDPAERHHRGSRDRTPSSRQALGGDRKGKLSLAALRGRDPARLREPVDLGRALRRVALIWLVPDPRIEATLKE